MAASLLPHAQRALDDLIAGNGRYVEGSSSTQISSVQRVELANGQAPIAVVLGCSDSRVPIETIFDQAPGKVFVVRVAGNILNEDNLATIEYAVELLNVGLVLILGHSGCGAVQAAVAHLEHGTVFPGHIQRLADAIAPAARSAASQGGDWMEKAVAENVRVTAGALLERSPLVAKAVQEHRLSIAGGVYDLHSGRVTTLQ